MKKLLICFAFLSMMGGKCFSQGDDPNRFYVPDELWETFMKGYQLGAEGKWGEAFSYFKVVADKGNVSFAQNEVAACYRDGDGIPVNFTESFKYMYKAATNPKPWGPSFCNLAEMYRLGIGTPKNLEEAFKWYYKGTGTEKIPYVITDEETIAKCMYAVGYAYLMGEGVQQNGTKATFWMEKSYEHGYTKVAGTLALAYLSGELDIEKNEVEGVKWLKRTDIDHDGYWQYEMGKVYKYGIGNTPINKEEALKWFRKASANGYTKALDEIRALEK